MRQIENKHFMPLLRYHRYRSEKITRHILDMLDRGEITLTVAKASVESICDASSKGVNWNKG